MKKGAMFGLDARIALVIIALLTIIAGALLYQENSKITGVTMVAQLEQLGKAWDQRYYDVGMDLPRISVSGYSSLIPYDVTSLREDVGEIGWKGPYMAEGFFGKLNATSSAFKVTKVSTVSEGTMEFLNEEEDWDTGDQTLRECSSAAHSCGAWATLTGISNLDTIVSADKAVDGNTGALKGKLRWLYLDSTNHYKIFLKIAPLDNPN